VNDGMAKRQVVVGGVIVLALVLLGISILAIGSESRMFAKKQHYSTQFKDVLGLKVGSPVYLSGVQVGSIEGIDLPTDPERTGIVVDMAVDERYSARIREGTKASLSFLQLLSGDKLIILEPGDPKLPPLPRGAIIPPNESATLFEAGTSAAQNLTEITDKLNDILQPIQEGIRNKSGLFGQMIGDPNFGQEGLKNLNESLAQAQVLLKSLNEGQGLAGRLINDREYARTTLDSLSSTLKRMDALLARFETEDGALGALLKKDGDGQKAIAELKAGSEELHQLLVRIRTGDGLASKLIYDDEFGREMTANLKRSSASMASILEKVDRGEGTLGGLVNDPTVYQGLQDIVSGVKGSKLGTGFLRHYQKKGEKAAAAEPGTGSKEPAKP
jgi:phospholipid/cholesterol/gamma-HCH transport system substrate-binding protein